MLRPLIAGAVVGLCLAHAPGLPAADKSKAEQALEAKGIRVLGSYLALEEETDLSRMFREASKLKRDVILAQRELDVVNAQETQKKKAMIDYTQKRQQLRAQLNATTNPIQQNALINAINELTDRTNLLIETDFSEQSKAARDKANQAREAYVQKLLEMEKLAQQIQQKYDTLAVDPEVKSAIADLNKQTGKKYEMVESRGFQANLKNLQKLQDAVISESIDLRDDGSDTFWVPVVFSGKHAKELVLDSGASVISLPYKMAEDMGLAPGSDAPIVILSLADGSMVEGRQINIPEVRVGKFTVEDVEGVVLPADLPNAPALLGMSFLKNFDFKIDSAAKKLTMTKVETDEGTSRTRGRRP